MLAFERFCYENQRNGCVFIAFPTFLMIFRYWVPDPRLAGFHQNHEMVGKQIYFEAKVPKLSFSKAVPILTTKSIKIVSFPSFPAFLNENQRNRCVSTVFTASSLIFKQLGAGPRTSQISSKSPKAVKTCLFRNPNAKTNVFSAAFQYLFFQKNIEVIVFSRLFQVCV